MMPIGNEVIPREIQFLIAHLLVWNSTAFQINIIQSSANNVIHQNFQVASCKTYFNVIDTVSLFQLNPLCTQTQYPFNQDNNSFRYFKVVVINI